MLVLTICQQNTKLIVRYIGLIAAACFEDLHLMFYLLCIHCLFILEVIYFSLMLLTNS